MRADTAYIRTKARFIYFSAIIDWHSKAILRYKLSNSMVQCLSLDLLQEALSSVT
ncbi:protein of unknown function [Cardinium endosymbiont cEper1 of Encarsia pergandiella]|nr:protein of unknown function [Cardinium endosymbiont cEper1 of Encarsia pergandiella]